jgi:sialidase-1
LRRGVHHLYIADSDKRGPQMAEQAGDRRVELAEFLGVMFALWALADAAAAPAAAAGADEPQFKTVFVSGENDYELIRTPQILTTRQRTLLVFAQGREGQHDQSANDIVLKRSTDGGGTWSPLKVIAEDGDNSLNSICVLQVRETNRILVVGCIIPAGYNLQDYRYLSPGMQEYYRRNQRQDWPAIAPGYGAGAARVYVVHSDDDGRTWSKMRDITRSAKRPEGALTCIPGPGLGVQLRHGASKGRIVIPCNQLWLERRGGAASYYTAPYAVLSDDFGATWRWGELAAPSGRPPRLSANETQMVELDDGAVQLNARAVGRVVATSRDGGQSWSDLLEEPALKGPPCAAGLLRYSSAHDGEKSRILFSLPMGDRRQDGTVWLSCDEGRTWPASRTLRPGRFGYSCLTRLPDGRIGCVFDGRHEQKPANKAGVIFARFSLEWLTNGRDQTPH